MSQSRVSEPGFPLSLASTFSFAVVVTVLLVGLALMDRWTFFMVVAVIGIPGLGMLWTTRKRAIEERQFG